MNILLGFLLTGLLAGTFSGFLGIGGGIILIPALVYVFGFSQKMAQGTTLAAMVPPIGILAAMVYWKNGNVDLKAAAFIALGFLIGGLIGGVTVQYIPEVLLRKGFALVLIFFAIKLLAE